MAAANKNGNFATHVGQVASDVQRVMSSAAGSIRLLLVDDHEVLLRGIERLIETEAPDVTIVGRAMNGEDAVRLVKELAPDVVLLDLDLGAEPNGLAVLPRLLSNGKPAVLVYTGVRDKAAHREAVMLGARGVAHKSSDPQLLLKAIRCVMAGELWLDRISTGQVLSALLQGVDLRAAKIEDPRVAKLTRREREIVAAICTNAGRPAKRLAATLQISEHTLRNHLSAIYEKLGVTNRAELCAFGESNGLVPFASEQY